MLNAAVVYGTGRRAALPDQPAGGKTGTTQDFRDAWFIGFTSHLTAAVWVGNDNGKPMIRGTGGSLPAEIWRQVMRVAHQGKAPLPLAGTVNASVENEAADWSGNPLVLASTASRPPRVVEAREVLPWTLLGGGQSADGAPHLSVAAGFSHPADNIGEDFIADALSATSGEVRPAPAASAPQPARTSSGILPFGSWW
jgi:penicillin-binding protein 1A